MQADVRSIKVFLPMFQFSFDFRGPVNEGISSAPSELRKKINYIWLKSILEQVWLKHCASFQT